MFPLPGNTRAGKPLLLDGTLSAATEVDSDNLGGSYAITIGPPEHIARLAPIQM